MSLATFALRNSRQCLFNVFATTRPGRLVTDVAGDFRTHFFSKKLDPGRQPHVDTPVIVGDYFTRP